jgi:tripartite-type tricarboxylate transporter receptor subunit TctC
MPQLASTTESKALKTFTAEIGTGYFVKRDTPEAIVQTMHKAIQSVIGDAEFKASMVAMGQEVSALQSLEVANKAFVDETTQYRAIGKSINLQPQ